MRWSRFLRYFGRSSLVALAFAAYWGQYGLVEMACTVWGVWSCAFAEVAAAHEQRTEAGRILRLRAKRARGPRPRLWIDRQAEGYWRR